MGENRNGSNEKGSNEKENFKPNGIETKVKELEEKLEVIENTNAVLEDKVRSYEDPSKKPRTIQRGYVKKNLKFEKNDIKINPSTGERTTAKRKAKN